MLALVIERPSYGYELYERFGRRFGEFLPASQGNVYDALKRLEREGYVEFAGWGGRNGLQLHRILAHTVRPAAGPVDHYAHNPQHEDSGYLETLEGACRDTLKGLPSIATVNQLLDNAAKRCGEAQARNHAITVEGCDQLIHWSREQAPRSGYLWWELAAAGISCLAIHALFAAAATPRMTSREAQLIDAAYFPPVCAISALLDSLIDLPHDASTTNKRGTSTAYRYLSTLLILGLAA